MGDAPDTTQAVSVNAADDENRAHRERTREILESGDVDPEDIRDPAIRKAVEEAQAERETDTDTDVEPDEVPETVQLDSDPVSNVDETKSGSIGQALSEASENRRTEANDELEEAADSLLSDLDEDDLEDAAEIELNVVDDIEPEHFDYENQDFSSFGGYGEQTTIEYNDAYFLLVQPGERKQQQLMNQMQGFGSQNFDKMLEMLIEAAVARPDPIEEYLAEWSPFERMGLGLQCMEFLGLDALGNI